MFRSSSQWFHVVWLSIDQSIKIVSCSCARVLWLRYLLSRQSDQSGVQEVCLANSTLNYHRVSCSLHSSNICQLPLRSCLERQVYGLDPGCRSPASTCIWIRFSCRFQLLICRPTYYPRICNYNDENHSTSWAVYWVPCERLASRPAWISMVSISLVF